MWNEMKRVAKRKCFCKLEDYLFAFLSQFFLCFSVLQNISANIWKRWWYKYSVRSDDDVHHFTSSYFSLVGWLRKVIIFTTFLCFLPQNTTTVLYMFSKYTTWQGEMLQVMHFAVFFISNLHDCIICTMGDPTFCCRTCFGVFNCTPFAVLVHTRSIYLSPAPCSLFFVSWVFYCEINSNNEDQVYTVFIWGYFYCVDFSH